MIAAVLLSSLLSTVPTHGALDALRLHVTPRTSLSPGHVRAEATVARHPDNRQLTFVADSSAYYSSASKDLDGGADALIHEVLFERLPEGVYVVRATLTRANGERFVEEAVFEVH